MTSLMSFTSAARHTHEKLSRASAGGLVDRQRKVLRDQGTEGGARAWEGGMDREWGWGGLGLGCGAGLGVGVGGSGGRASGVERARSNAPSAERGPGRGGGGSTAEPAAYLAAGPLRPPPERGEPQRGRQTNHWGGLPATAGRAQQKLLPMPSRTEPQPRARGARGWLPQERVRGIAG